MWVLAFWLIVDGAGGGLAVAHLLPSLGASHTVFAVLLFLRLASRALSLVRGSAIAGRRPQGHARAPAALVCSAILTTIDAGSGVLSAGALAPYRWLIVVSVWAWAAGWTMALRRRALR
jgi:hypothetical protein